MEEIQTLEHNTEIKNSAKSRILKGIPSSSGMAMGNAVILKADTVSSLVQELDTQEIPKEIERFKTAIDEVIREYELVIAKVDSYQKNVIAVLETNIFILQDPFLSDEIIDSINKGISAESSVIQAFDSRKLILMSAKDSIIRDRAFELDNIKERLLASLRYRCIFYAIAEGSIVVAKSVTPTDLVNFKEAKVSGIITEVGGITAHCSILARSFEIPAVIGVANATSLIAPNSNVIVNGYAGWALTNPNKKAISNYEFSPY